MFEKPQPTDFVTIPTFDFLSVSWFILNRRQSDKHKTGTFLDSARCSRWNKKSGCKEY